MPRLEKSISVDSRRPTRDDAPAERHTAASSTRLASTSLMPAGCCLAIPRVDGVPPEQQLWQGEQAAARLAHSLVEAGIADADDWIGANHNPFQFLKAALERWLSETGESGVREQFS